MSAPLALWEGSQQAQLKALASSSEQSLLLRPRRVGVGTAVDVGRTKAPAAARGVGHCSGRRTKA